MSECSAGCFLTVKSKKLTESIIGLYTKKAINVFAFVAIFSAASRGEKIAWWAFMDVDNFLIKS
ncbi:MAG: hypothetical protein Q7J74_12870 [Pseudomonas sp.]|nr:hypothetical protein [Pseudomonas sp.]